MSDPVRDFLQDPTTKGMAIINADFAFVAGAAAVPQGIDIRCSLIFAEVWTDESLGVDIVGSVLIRNPDPLLIRALYSEQIAATPDVTSVQGAALVGPSSDRIASIAYQCATIYSADQVAGQTG